MCQLDPLLIGRKHHRVITHHHTAAQRGKADIPNVAFTGVAVTDPLRNFIQINLTTRCRCLP